ncbi:MAG: hypothetical protein ACYCXW_24325 [Solirubrobacteraceae bacterium]
MRTLTLRVLILAACIACAVVLPGCPSSFGLQDRAFAWPLEMVLAAAASGWAIGEAPVAYRRRAGGRSKVSGSVRGTCRALRDMSRLLASTGNAAGGVKDSARLGPKLTRC